MGRDFQAGPGGGEGNFLDQGPLCSILRIFVGNYQIKVLGISGMTEKWSRQDRI